MYYVHVTNSYIRSGYYRIFFPPMQHCVLAHSMPTEKRDDASSIAHGTFFPRFCTFNSFGLPAAHLIMRRTPAARPGGVAFVSKLWPRHRRST